MKRTEQVRICPAAKVTLTVTVKARQMECVRGILQLFIYNTKDKDFDGFSSQEKDKDS